MNTYIKFIIKNYLKAVCYVFLVIFSLVVILNTLSEIEFFDSFEVNSLLPIYLSLLNSFDLIFEVFPFIFLIASQIFCLNLFTNNQINIFKYSGLKNSVILIIVGFTTFCLGIAIITMYYSLSSNLKNLYLENKNKYSSNKYLAVVTNNGLWMKDEINKIKYITNAQEIDNNFLKNVVISEFSKNFELIRIINSKKIDIKSNKWILYDVKLLENNNKFTKDTMTINSNFNYLRINNLFSNLSSLSILELIELKKNYNQINYSTIEIDIKLQKLLSYPFYYSLMALFSFMIMLNTKKFKSISFKISIGLFCCVVVYYINNISQVLSNSENISTTFSIWISPIILLISNSIMMIKINEK
jgi:lipopolysaccharide export system permease protein